MKVLIVLALFLILLIIGAELIGHNSLPIAIGIPLIFLFLWFLDKPRRKKKE